MAHDSTANDSAPNPQLKITDRDIELLLKRGVEEMASDPAAAGVYWRIQHREVVAHHRRDRADRCVAAGLLAGLAVFAVLAAVFRL
ncbi:hypothetical protein [Streptomyces sp. MS2.AVA.5]|uniref:Uncharacterized protein n=1 Tax=Streptomyces achmelvichensis TaxID=3134111 RepID=A0ACC6Q8E7_9ACTN